MPRPLFDAEHLFGLHDPGGEDLILNAGRTGWVLFTEEIGHDPTNTGGRDYSAYSNRGLGVIVRLNNGYEPNGTIPNSALYADFAQRCANFVANSNGCKIWIIGNEMNHHVERPPATVRTDSPRTLARPRSSALDAGEADGDAQHTLFLPMTAGGGGPDPDPRKRSGRFTALDEAQADQPEAAMDAAARAPATPTIVDGREVITPTLYARCYTLCRAAIHSRSGHSNDQVVIGAPAPWNNQTRYSGNPNGDWVQYLTDILTLLGPDGCDAIALHTYTHQADANLITSDGKMAPPFENRHFEFRAYQDFMAGIPQTMRHLPVYITETDQDVPWLDQNIAWVQRAYGEINFWNQQPGNQQIRSLILYRWLPFDQWVIQGKQGVIDDFVEAMRNDYRWQASPPPPAGYRAGDILATTNFVNLRRTPGFANQPPGDVLYTIPENDRVVVIDSRPRTADGLIWWNVEFVAPTGLLAGWLAQYDGNGIPLVRLDEAGPTDPGGKPPGPPDEGIGVGVLVQTTTVVRLRRTPGFANKPPGDVLADMPQGTRGAVVDGPRQVDGLIWWEVRGGDGSTAFAGWMAEATSAGVQLLERVGVVPPPPGTGNGGGENGGENGGGGDGPRPGIQVGDRVRTLTIVRFRRTPGFSNKPDSDVIADLSEGTIGTAVGGPRVVDGLIWWQVQAPVSGSQQVGWMAQATSAGVPLLEEVSTTPPPEPPPGEGSFSIGQTVVTQDFVRMRRSPGYANKPASDVVRDLPPGTRGVIQGGPRPADGLTWWDVDARPADTGVAVRGWMAETAPGGQLLLAAADGSGEPDGGSGEFRPGELIQTLSAVRVRATPGTANKPPNDVLGAFDPGTTLNVVDGPRPADGYTWWRVGGIAQGGISMVGWVAQQIPGGAALVGRAPVLPGTDIPNPAAGRYLGAPYQGRFGISQLWGERPGFYSQFSYDGVPLRGHNGIDFLTPNGVTLLATDAGEVLAAVTNDQTGLGVYVLLKHAWGESIYAHMAEISVRPGQRVQRGTVIGTSDNTGNTDGPHLHFAIRINPYSRTDGWGGYSDPLPYLNPADYELPDWVLPPERREQPLGAPAPAAGAAPPLGSGLAPDQPGVRRP